MHSYNIKKILFQNCEWNNNCTAKPSVSFAESVAGICNLLKRRDPFIHVQTMLQYSGTSSGCLFLPMTPTFTLSISARHATLPSTTSEMADPLHYKWRCVSGNHTRRMGALHAFEQSRHRKEGDQ